MCLISTGHWDNLKPVEGVDPNTLKIFANICSELTSVDGNFVLCGSCIVVPNALQNQVVKLAHEGHQGLVKTCSLLHSKVWFPRMDSLVDSVVKRCVPCQVATPKPSREPPYGARNGNNFLYFSLSTSDKRTKDFLLFDR